LTAAPQPRPRRRFGQHFLHDRAVLQRIVDHIAPRRDDALVEIGPGRGALTAMLAPLVARLDAVEVDRDMVDFLRAAQNQSAQVVVHHADALRFDYDALAAERGALRVVGNLPYNIATPLLFSCARLRCLRDMVFMVQFEVARRLCAAPGDADYGRLTVMFGLRCEAEPLFTVGPGAFTPPPKVKSTLIKARPRATPAAEVRDSALFAEVVRRAFSARRKTLRRALAGMCGAAEFAAAAVDGARRAGELTITDFAALANAAGRL